MLKVNRIFWKNEDFVHTVGEFVNHEENYTWTLKYNGNQRWGTSVGKLVFNSDVRHALVELLNPDIEIHWEGQN